MEKSSGEVSGRGTTEWPYPATEMNPYVVRPILVGNTGEKSELGLCRHPTRW